MLSEHEYLKQHGVVQLFDELTAALLADKPEEPTGFIVDWLKARLPTTLKLNTSNQNKFKEFQRIFGKYNMALESTHVDLDEIDATPEQVVAHKATSAGDGILVEDTSLDIEGADVGINVRWLLDNLTQFCGKKATWRVLLGLKKEGTDKVELYEGIVYGIIVQPRGGGFGFDPVVEVIGTGKTLGESKPDEHNARAKAVENLARGKVYRVEPAIYKWEGKWQK
eukprot:TRINITY_DN66617_c4_g8_i1.p1 TRINITY_DN66617_c4_g8~~TRINITY_DN66617_c4_g8_i1.p1  ORF type:complete len:224 (+),score=17.83 TRINITY_DN66617_c4_g8_i1:27-698(+)